MVAIIDYGTGNMKSITGAVERCGFDYCVTDDSDLILGASKVILPGVGAAQTAMSNLRAKSLDVVIPKIKGDVLGICIGMQIMCSYSEEGDVNCLSIFPNIVRRLHGDGIKVPHMGWNRLLQMRGDIFNGIPENAYQYFVHSYAPDVDNCTIATTSYGNLFSSALQRGNFYGTQFHPEKSGEMGEKILFNFLTM